MGQIGGNLGTKFSETGVILISWNLGKKTMYLPNPLIYPTTHTHLALPGSYQTEQDI